MRAPPVLLGPLRPLPPHDGGEVETFSYDRWGRLAARARGGLVETYAYDHFGRLVEKDEDGAVTSYAYDAWGNRTLRVTRGRDGAVTSRETRSYDRLGRLVETAADFGSRVTYAYDARGRLARQTVDGTPIDYAYTRHGRLAGKYLGGRLDPDAAVEYEYSPSGRVVARTANGVRQDYGYDRRGRLVAVREDGADVERYAYDAAGNVVRRTVRGRTTTFAFDAANQLVSSTCGGVTTRYAYDAAGRLVREGDRAYRYGYLDKVLAVTGGGRTLAYAYHPDGQLARADYGGGRTEDFEWDGLALVRRGGEQLLNEPHTGGGSPVLSSSGTAYFGDILGTTLGEKERGRRYAAARQTAFGDGDAAYFTGKPAVAGLGRAFLYRNYRPDLAKWQTADPLGYPDGWNSLAYGPNSPLSGFDLLGASWGNAEMVAYYFRYTPISLMSPTLRSVWDLIRPLVVDDSLDTDTMGLTDAIFSLMDAKANEIIDEYVTSVIMKSLSGNVPKQPYSRPFGVSCGSIVWALGGGSGNLSGELSISWNTEFEIDHRGCRYMVKSYSWEFVGEMKYSDSFKDPIDVINYIDRPDLEAPTGAPYDYGHIWKNYRATGQGKKRFLEE